MKIEVDTETGHGRVKTMNGDVPHSAAFVGGDVDRAAKLGITDHVKSFWTHGMKTQFKAKKVAKAKKDKADAKIEADAKKVAKEAEQARFDAAVDAAVARRG